MSEKDHPSPAGPDASPAKGERIARRLSRAGIASRRDAERMISEGRVAVNGVVIATPAFFVSPSDRVAVDGTPVAEPEPVRLWLYHKPPGLVTSARDEKGRATVFDSLPADLPRVMPVGRLDLTSEGLLLLTNDGALKRRLELPSTGWLRKYRVRVKGTPDDRTLEPLRKGIAIEGERFQPMAVTLDRQQGANAWLTVALREGRNREIRRAMEAVGMAVNRLIRVSYGPFQLGTLEPGAVEEVRARVLRDQLGIGPADQAPTGTAKAQPAGAKRKGAARARPHEGDAAPPRRRGERPADATAGKGKGPAKAARGAPDAPARRGGSGERIPRGGPTDRMARGGRAERSPSGTDAGPAGTPPRPRRKPGPRKG